MIKEVTSNNFNLNINKTNETPPVLQLKEIISNTFSLIINKEEAMPPIQIDNLDEALKDYTAKLEHIRKCMQIANERISKNVFDLKTYEDIFNKLTDNGKKKALMIESGELYINSAYIKNNEVQYDAPLENLKTAFVTNTYFNDGVIIDNTKIITEEKIRIDNVIDNIEFISDTSTSELQIDVTKLRNTKFVETNDKSDNVYINESELLKLALLEIKKLKQELSVLKKT